MYFENSTTFYGQLMHFLFIYSVHLINFELFEYPFHNVFEYLELQITIYLWFNYLN